MSKTRDLANLADLNFDSGTMVVDKANDRVGVGNAAPATALDVTGTVTSYGLDLGTNNPRIRFDDSDTSNNGEVTLDNTSLRIEIDEDNVVASSAIHFRVDGDNKVTVNESGNVGIGTSSPSTNLHIVGKARVQRATNATIEIVADNNTGANPFSVGSNSDTFFIKNQAASGFGTGGDVIRYTEGGSLQLMGVNYIDSSGNLLVGTTTNGTTVDGTVIRASAETLMTRSNGAPLLLNRRGTDGAVIEVRNDNSAVGYISANASGMGVYLGGTGSANHLDDYEEGTWTPDPQDNSGNSGSAGTASGYYTKIGNVVFATVLLENINTSGLTSTQNFRIYGLPFTAASLVGFQIFTGDARMNSVTFSGNPNLAILDSTNYIRIGETNSGATSDFVVVSQVASGAADIYGSITYMAA